MARKSRSQDNNIYIDSSKVRIYPCGNRADYGKLDNLNLEQNIIKPHNTITDINSYVISGLNLSMTRQEGTNTYTFTLHPGEGVINGYYFKVLSEISFDKTWVIDYLHPDRKYIIFLRCVMTAKQVSNNTIYEIRSDNTTLEFTGISLDFEMNFFEPYLDNGLYLKLGYVYNKAASSTIIDIGLVNEPTISKFYTNNMRIDINSATNLADEDINNKSFEDYLNENFILDDGELITFQEVPEIIDQDLIGE